ncbi:alpha/beta hydrolase family protein [Brevundimonas sp. R86498]|uniref:alpha/beta hydrolase family protein n=1 Tax=Brevundimonas sp. R86498 TaxID=3093845 RepID=UPI0037C87704
MAAIAEIEPSHVMLPAPDGRTIDLNVWAAPKEKGIVVYSHGFNGSPAAYQRILSAWASHGFTVIAPLHVDSLRHPQHAQYDNGQAFTTRLTDLAVARGFARQTHASRPIVVAGHSFGSLMSMIAGGAVTVAGPLGDPEVKGVIAFSTAGDVPPLVQPETYQGLTGPLLLVSGDQDRVQGFVTDPSDHRHPYELSPVGDKTMITFSGADHELVANADDADFAVLIEATEAFLDAYGLGDAVAKARLTALPAPDGVTIERR